MCHLLKISLAHIALGLLQALPAGEPDFYLAENAKYTIVRSALDSANFTLKHCVVLLPKGRLAAKSSFVNENGEVMGWHDFGPLEGPGS